MSKITLEDIKIGGGPAPAELRELVKSSYDGASYNVPAKLARPIKAFVVRYNNAHPNEQTNLLEVYDLLAGVVRTDEERDNLYIQEVKSKMDENNLIVAICPKIISYFCSRGNTRYVKADSRAISKVIEKFVPGAVYKPHKEFTDQEIVNMLKAVTDENGVVDLSKDKTLLSVFRMKSHVKRSNNLTYGEILDQLGYKYSYIKGAPIDKQTHITNILDCLDEDTHEINDLFTKYPTTYSCIFKLAKRENISIEEAINLYLKDEINYRVYYDATRVSKYSFNNPKFKELFDCYKESVVHAIKSCMKPDGTMSGFVYFTAAYGIVKEISVFNNISMQEAVNLFVQDAIYVPAPEKKFSYKTPKDIFEALKYYEDENGCVDSARKNTHLMQSLRNLALSEGKNLGEYIASNPNIRFSKFKFNVDAIDFVVCMLNHKHNGNLRELYLKDKKLYDMLRKVRYFFPDGAKATIEETAEALGFYYEGLHTPFEISEREIISDIHKIYGNETDLENVGDHKALYRKILRYSGLVGKNIEDTLKDLGYTYKYDRRYNSQSRLNKVQLSIEEYIEYINIKGKELPKEDLLEAE